MIIIIMIMMMISICIINIVMIYYDSSTKVVNIGGNNPVGVLGHVISIYIYIYI